MKLFFFRMKGKLLISSPGLLTDMIFYKSIILLVEESSDGYTGFILNRPGGILFMNNENPDEYLIATIVCLESWYFVCNGSDLNLLEFLDLDPLEYICFSNYFLPI